MRYLSYLCFMTPGNRMDKADLEALKQANPIEEVARDLGLIVTAHKIRCPKPDRHTHGDRSPSVTFWPERGSFRCWVCPDVKGDVIELVRLMQGCGFGEALRWLRARSGIPESNGSGPRPSVFPTPAPSKASTRPTLAPPMHQGQAEPTLDFDAAPPEPALPNRSEVLRALLDLSIPISGAAARYLQARRIFKRTWDKQGLKWIDDYGRISRGLADRFGVAALQKLGFFNAEGHLRYYRHVLLFPYFDATGAPVYMQARALQATVTPKELSLSGPIPLPYNVLALKEANRNVFLCEGVIDTLTLLEQGQLAVGIPGASNFKAEWAPLFKDKVVFVAFDPDAAGEAGAHRVAALLGEIGIASHRQHLPGGKDINEWLRKGDRSDWGGDAADSHGDKNKS